ncbi:class IIb bacteriocin, lactobin A/cerein 7B family [Anabaena minutissima FACHB-250]|nr:class IIb bacteriocin, lactobin A/cerein 7B family [Anabaena minutissima FACHB-250]
MSNIVISDLSQENILTDLSDEQINDIQGGGILGATIIVVVAAAAVTTYLAGYKDGADSCKI